MSFPTPKPRSYFGGGVLPITSISPRGGAGGFGGGPPPISIVHPLTTRVSSESMPKSSLITPDGSPRDESDYVEESCSPLDAAKKISLVLSKGVLAANHYQHQGDMQHQAQHLIPRPAKVGISVGPPPSIPMIPRRSKSEQSNGGGGLRLNKFVRRLHDMLQAEKDSGIVEWRRGLLVLYSTDAFAKTILPKYFNTRNFKTFRRQLNYYGFVHVRSFSTTGSSTTALWVNRELAKEAASDNISSVLMLKRVEPCESAKTAEGRRNRKEMALSTVEEDIGVSAKTLQLEQIRSMALRGDDDALFGPCTSLRTFQAPPQHEQTRPTAIPRQQPPIPREVHVPTDGSSGSNCGSSYSNEDSEDYNTTSSQEEDTASASAANVLLMLAQSHS